ncbi:hypothetical protein ACHAPV_007469 [Trichoderma viride]
MASTDKEMVRQVKAIRQGLALEILIKEFEKQAQTNANGIPAPRESTKNKEPAISSPETSATGSDRDELVPVFKLHDEARGGQPSPNGPRRSLLDDSTTTSSEIDEAMDISSAEENSNLVQKRQVSPAATKSDGSSAKRRYNSAKYGASSSSTKNHEPSPRHTSNKKDFYSIMTTRIREKGLPTSKQSASCTCQAELQELQKAVQKMNDSLGGLARTLEQVVAKLKLNTVAQDARIHRKGTQRLIAAANGGSTPTDSEDDARDVWASQRVKLW